jgi:Ni/Fe-hydrogenase 1 B-type cytochrome subunit
MEATVKQPDRYHVYVWEFPVRLFHWVNALCIVVLGVTGYLIGNPVALHSDAEPSYQYWFGTVRFIHFTAAYVWIFNTVVRLYWGFVGNEYVRFRNFLPLTLAQWKEIGAVTRMDILQVYRGATFSVGHNALAGLAYLVGFLAFLFMTLTGFGMYAAMSKGWFAGLFAWVVPTMGGDHLVRIWHHMGLWFFLVFMLVHVYLSAYHDYVEATGTISSMFGGWKFLRKKPDRPARRRGRRRDSVNPPEPPG